MTNERLKELAYEPIGKAWEIIHMTQNLKPDDTKEWRKYIQAHDEFCKKYDQGSETSYGYYLGMAIMAVVDEIAKENNSEQA